MELPSEFAPQHTQSIQACISLAEACGWDASHSLHVTRLALRLFDELQPLHELGYLEKFWLYCAGILHDIGWLEGQKGHHKTSLRIILTSPMMPFTNKERLIIGSIARYHRRALPSLRHDHFAALTAAEQQKVILLAALLRQADGLDYSHQLRVRDLSCKVKPGRLVIHCLLQASSDEAEKAGEKSDLLAQVLKRQVKLRWISTPSTSQ